MPEFEIDGKKFSCKKWTVKDLFSFNELQSKIEEFGPTDKLVGKKANEALSLTVEYISSQIGIAKEEIMGWENEMLGKVLAGIIQANNTLPKAVTAVAPSLSSPGSSTPAT